MDPMIKNSFFTILIYWNDNRIHLGLTKKLIFFILFPPLILLRCPQVGPHLQNSPDIGDKGGGVILGDRVELPAAGLAQPDHRALHGGSQL